MNEPPIMFYRYHKTTSHLYIRSRAPNSVNYNFFLKAPVSTVETPSYTIPIKVNDIPSFKDYMLPKYRELANDYFWYKRFLMFITFSTTSRNITDISFLKYLKPTDDNLVNQILRSYEAMIALIGEDYGMSLKSLKVKYTTVQYNYSMPSYYIQGVHHIVCKYQTYILYRLRIIRLELNKVIEERLTKDI